MEDLEDNISSFVADLGEPLLEVIRTLAAMPQVSLTNKPLVLGDTAQKTYAQVWLLCCNKPCQVKCNTYTDDRSTPDVLVAAQKLVLKVQRDHGGSACSLAAMESRASKGWPATGRPLVEQHAFEEMMARQLAISRAKVEQKKAQEEKADLEQELAQLRRRLADNARRSELAAKALVELQPPRKRAKSDGGFDAGAAAAESARHPPSRAERHSRAKRRAPSRWSP